MKKFLLILIPIIIIGISIVIFSRGEQYQEILNFAECKSAGYSIIETYPRQCRTPDNKVFSEDVKNDTDNTDVASATSDQFVLQNTDLIQIEQPRPNTAIASPLVIKGKARGQWFFEASFPIKLIDENGVEIAKGIATAKSDWMTTEFVPFDATLTFKKPSTSKGTLILKKDNPSDLPEHDNHVDIPIVFNQNVHYDAPVTIEACRPTGCSNQICSDQDVMTTCEYNDSYACYKEATCERQQNGECGWTHTETLKACLSTVE